MSVADQSQLLKKLLTLIANIQDKLSEDGLSKQEVSNYFSLKIFSQSSSSSGSKDAKSVNGLVKSFLEGQRKSGVALREVLNGILIRLEIENGLMEEYDNFESEHQPTLVLSKRQSSKSSMSEIPELRMQRSGSIWQNFDDSSTSVFTPRMQPKLSKLISLQKELSASLLKTKTLKSLIQKRMEVHSFVNGQLGVLA